MLILLASVLLVLSSGCAREPRTGASSGIAGLEEVALGGHRQWILIRGASADLPMLLWVPDGPGGSAMGWNGRYLAELEKSFLVATWEPPGAGKSFDRNALQRLDTRDYARLAVLLAAHLQARFGRKPILAGHGWGGMVAALAAQQRPELFAALVCVNPRIDFARSDAIAYRLALRGEGGTGENDAVPRLRRQGPPPYPVGSDGTFVLFQTLAAREVSAPFQAGTAFTAPEYSLLDTVNLIRSTRIGLREVYPRSADLDLRRHAVDLALPVVLLSGTEDPFCPAELLLDYYERLRAPGKSLHVFPEAGHYLCYSEPERFAAVLETELPAGRYP